MYIPSLSNGWFRSFRFYKQPSPEWAQTCLLGQGCKRCFSCRNCRPWTQRATMFSVWDFQKPGFWWPGASPRRANEMTGPRRTHIHMASTGCLKAQCYEKENPRKSHQRYGCARCCGSGQMQTTGSIQCSGHFLLLVLLFLNFSFYKWKTGGLEQLSKSFDLNQDWVSPRPESELGAMAHRKRRAIRGDIHMSSTEPRM